MIFDNLKFKKGVVHEDNFFTYQALYKTKKVINIDCALYYHRNTENSITNSNFNIGRLSTVDAYLEAMVFYKNKGLSKLHDFALFYLMNIIKWDYYCVDRYISNKPTKVKHKVRLRSLFKHNYIQAMKTKYINLKSKIAFTFFLALPTLYNYYYYIKDNK